MSEGLCLRIYLSESSRIDGKPAMEEILNLCKNAGLTGVSVLRGVEGMGQHGVHSASFLELASSLPLVVEAIAPRELMQQAITTMKPHLGEFLVATWPVNLINDGEKHGNA